MTALSAIARWRPSLERLAAVGIVAYVALLLVGPLKWQTETDSTIPLSWSLAHVLWSDDRLTRPEYVPVNGALFTVFGLLPVVFVYLLQLRAALRGDVREPITLRRIVIYTLIYSAAVFFIPKTLSSDVFSYIAYGRISAVYHGNPLVDVPADFQDSMFQHIAFGPFGYVPSAYGPVWIAVSHLLSLLVGASGDVDWHYEVAYKLLAIGCHVACVGLIWSILSRVRPEHRLAGTVLYAWNPLMLAETAWNAHNDVLLLLLVLGAVWARSRERRTLGLVILAVSVPVKWITAILVPLYITAEARSSPTRSLALRRAVGMSALAAVVIAVTFIPYWRGPVTLDAIRHAPGNHFTTNSLSDMVLTESRWADYRRAHPDYDPATRPPGLHRLPNSPESLIADSYAPMIAARANTHRLDWSLEPARPHGGLERGLRWLTAAIFLAVFAYWLQRSRDVDTMLHAWGWCLFAYVTSAAMWVWPWYLVWVLGVASLVGWDRLGQTAAILGISGSMMYFSSLLGPMGYRLRSVAAFAPPLGFLLWTEWRARRIGRGTAKRIEA